MLNPLLRHTKFHWLWAIFSKVDQKLWVYENRIIAKFEGDRIFPKGPSPPLNLPKFPENVKIVIIQGNVNFIVETSSRAYFKDNLMLIKDWIGTRPLKSTVFDLRRGVRWTPVLVIPTPRKSKTVDFWGIVPIQSLISVKLSLK